jgi:hypothetical protein
MKNGTVYKTSSIMFIRSLLTMILMAGTLLAQTDPALKTFDKDGLKFSYPADWTVTDRSSEGIQDIRLSKKDSQTLISLVSPRAPIVNYDQFREMQSDIQDRFMINIKRSLNTEAQTTREESACLDFNGRDVTGMRYSGFYKEQPSVGDVFPFVLGDRYLNMIYMRSERDEALGDAAWKTVTGSLYLQNAHRDSARFNFPTDFFPAGDVRGLALEIGRPNLPFNVGTRNGITVVVQVEINEKGKVSNAYSNSVATGGAIGGASIVLECVKAARFSKFEPTTICGKAVKIRGYIIYKILPSNDPRIQNG